MMSSGRPPASESIELLRQVKKKFPDKSIWAFSGFFFEDIAGGRVGDSAVAREFLSYLDAWC